MGFLDESAFSVHGALARDEAEFFDIGFEKGGEIALEASLVNGGSNFREQCPITGNKGDFAFGVVSIRHGLPAFFHDALNKPEICVVDPSSHEFSLGIFDRGRIAQNQRVRSEDAIHFLIGMHIFDIGPGERVRRDKFPLFNRLKPFFLRNILAQ